MWKDYERCFGNWKKSGTHEEMGQIIVDKAFACFTNSRVFLYLHEFIAEDPTAFETVLGKLPASVFMESIDMSKMPPPSSASAKKGKKSNPEAAEYNAICKESLEMQKEAAAFKKQEAALKLIPSLDRELHRKDDIEKKRHAELLEAVIEADDLDDLPPKQRKKQAKQSMRRRMKAHGEWLMEWEGKEDDDDAPEPDTCESKINRYNDAVRSKSESEEALHKMRVQAGLIDG